MDQQPDAEITEAGSSAPAGGSGADVVAPVAPVGQPGALSAAGNLPEEAADGPADDESPAAGLPAECASCGNAHNGGDDVAAGAEPANAAGAAAQGPPAAETAASSEQAAVPVAITAADSPPRSPAGSPLAQLSEEASPGGSGSHLAEALSGAAAAHGHAAAAPHATTPPVPPAAEPLQAAGSTARRKSGGKSEAVVLEDGTVQWLLAQRALQQLHIPAAAMKQWSITEAETPCTLHLPGGERFKRSMFQQTKTSARLERWSPIAAALALRPGDLMHMRAAQLSPLVLHMHLARGGEVDQAAAAGGAASSSTAAAGSGGRQRLGGARRRQRPAASDTSDASESIPPVSDAGASECMPPPIKRARLKKAATPTRRSPAKEQVGH